MNKYIAGTYRQQYQYKSFSPALVNRPFRWEDDEIDILLEEAVKSLADLNQYSVHVPNIEFFLKMHVVKEADSTSRIEGTNTNIEEALISRDDIEPEKRDDWLEVHNYINAMNHAISSLDQIPLSIRLLKGAHEILLSGARGEHKAPGEIRKSQNWIGGSSLKDAMYIPPHQAELPDLLSDLEKFIHNSSIKMPVLVKTAICHYQFEAIHPFLDGNGRIGRLLITLLLVENKMLGKPVLYLSDYFDRNRNAYYESLTAVRTKNDPEQWIKFFLSAVISTSGKGIETFRAIAALRENYAVKLAKLGKRATLGEELLNKMYSQPIMNAATIADELKVSFTTASRLILVLAKAGILQERTGNARNRSFELREYLELFK